MIRAFLSLLCLLVASPAPADVVVPVKRTAVEFPAGQSSVVLPAHEDRSKFIVRVDIGGHGVDLLLDSGAAGITLEDGAAKELGLVSSGSFTNSANAGAFRSLILKVPLITIGPLTMRDVTVRSVPRILDMGPKGEYHAVGLLGFDFLRNVVVKLDYDNGTATVYDPAAFVAPDGAGTFALDIAVINGEPLVSATINGVASDRFLIDSGGFGTMLLLDRFTSANPSAVVDEGGGGARRNLRLIGLGGEILTKPVQLKSVQLGPITFTDLLAFTVDRSQYNQGIDGVIAPDLLHFFDVYLDYTHGKAYFVVNGSGKNVRS